MGSISIGETPWKKANRLAHTAACHWRNGNLHPMQALTVIFSTAIMIDVGILSKAGRRSVLNMIKILLTAIAITRKIKTKSPLFHGVLGTFP
jgi:hypothetical protein